MCKPGTASCKDLIVIICSFDFPHEDKFITFILASLITSEPGLVDSSNLAHRKRGGRLT